MTISIIGLGLMGGSLAFALRGFKNARILGVEKDALTAEKALAAGAVDEVLPMREAVAASDLVVFCVYPHVLLELISNHLPYFKKGAVVTDICGVKTGLYSAISELAPMNFEYVGIHPMAGKEVEGFDNATGELFRNTGFIIVPLTDDHLSADHLIKECLAMDHLPADRLVNDHLADDHLAKNHSAKNHLPADHLPNNQQSERGISLLKELAEYIGVARIAVAGPTLHDEIIAYTSDLMHISAAMLCVDQRMVNRAFTAGAYRDCTRIANINPGLWTELLLDNRSFVLGHLDNYIKNLEKVKTCLAEEDREGLYQLLDTAGKNKREMLKL